MIEILKAKIEKIVNACPTTNDFINEGFDLDYAKAISSDFNIGLKNNLEVGINDDLATLFNKNGEFRNFSFFGLSLNDFEEYEEFTTIGSQDVDFIAILKKTGEVVLVNEDPFEIAFYLANSFGEFLDIIPILVSYTKVGFLGGEYTPEFKKEITNSLENILQTKYFNFYKNRIGE